MMLNAPTLLAEIDNPFAIPLDTTTLLLVHLKTATKSAHEFNFF